jgi:STE24 endopeptidase
VSRILLLLIFVFWMAAPEYAHPPGRGAWVGVAIFLGYYVLLVLVMGVWGRLLARRVSARNLRRSLRRYNYTLLVARGMIPVWFAFGVFGLGWGEVVHRALGSTTTDLLRAAELPGLLLATLPPMAAWMGLWWSQYPAEIALREQSMLGQLEADLPVYAPPNFRDYFLSNVRLRLLFTVVPIFLIVLLRDVLLMAAARARPFGLPADWLDASAMFLAAALVFVFAPEILRRVLHTERLEDGPLRRRLEGMCRRSGMRYRDILVWRTHSNMGNAAVMGIVPQMRYVLLSDLLLETMTDDQIEAVFAHEMGHVVHRHMAWFVVFFVVMSVAMSGVMRVLDGLLGLDAQAVPEWAKPLMVAGWFFWVLLLFGFLSRRFERQADVYAARTMQAKAPAAGAPAAAGVASAAAQLVGAAAAASHAAAVTHPPAVAPADPRATTTPASRDPAAGPGRSHVGPYGATLFASALQRVAAINNIPLAPRTRWAGGPRARVEFVLERAGDLAHNWLHGSIFGRAQYLHRLSVDAARTHRFDRLMLGLYLALLFLLFASLTFLVAQGGWPGA